LANDGRCVVNRSTWVVSFESGGYATFCRNTPSILSAVEVISLTLPASTCVVKNV